ncbi:MAG: glycosyltransferase family 9 protein, partial [Planctomycetota bacterium]
RAHLAPTLEHGPWSEALVPIRSSREEVDALREVGADAALLLSNSLGAAWRARRAGIAVRAGAALGWRRPLLTHALVPPSRAGRRWPIPTAHLHRDLAGLVGLEVPDLHPRLFVSDERRATARAALERSGLAGEPYLVCCPGAAFGAAKLWPPEHFAAAIDALAASHGLRAVVTGAPSEATLVEAVVERSRSAVVTPAPEDRGLANLAAWIEASELLLVGDSGPRWFAAAFDVPCVSVMGPNFPELTATSLERAAIVRHEPELPCQPCLERRCPLGHQRCMTGLAPQRVIEAAERLLAEGWR